MPARPWPSILLASLTLGCSSGLDYAQLPTGELDGKLVVQWVRPDLFRFVPDEADPLTFRRGGTGEAITPGPMLTDGGSVPRALWAFRNYSPWGYAPAFVIHDWLFVQHHCGQPPAHTLEEAATIMAEAIKTQIEASGDAGPEEERVVAAMYAAVRSPIARSLWDDGACEGPTARMAEQPAQLEYVIDFGMPCAEMRPERVNPACPAGTRPAGPPFRPAE